MSFLEHLDELRQRLIKSLLSLVVGFAICWGFAEQIFAIMTQPMRDAHPGVTFIYTQPTEAFLLSRAPANPAAEDYMDFLKSAPVRTLIENAGYGSCQ